MLPKKERLKREDFGKSKTKVVFRGVYADVAAAPSNVFKVGCVISKSRIKKAVERNRIKRRLYGIIEKIEPKHPHQVVVYPKKEALNAKHQHIKEEIYKAFDTL